MGASKLLGEKATTAHASMVEVGEMRKAIGPLGELMVGNKQASAPVHGPETDSASGELTMTRPRRAWGPGTRPSR